MIRHYRIQEKWNEFSKLVLPPGCPDVQRTEMRRAFYAGMEGFLQIMLGGMEPGPDPSANDLKMMDELDEELKDFYERMKKGLV